MEKFTTSVTTMTGDFDTPAPSGACVQSGVSACVLSSCGACALGGISACVLGDDTACMDEETSEGGSQPAAECRHLAAGGSTGSADVCSPLVRTTHTSTAGAKQLFTIVDTIGSLGFAVRLFGDSHGN